MNKIEQFKIRNRKRNSHLYNDGLIENIDYIICPVSNERLSMIRKDYISKILNLDPDEYWLTYPNLPKSSPARQRNIQSGLKDIDPETGVTNHQKGILLAHATKSTPDGFGQTVYQKIGEKTKAAHLANVDDMGRNGYSQTASKNIIKGNQTKASKGIILPPEERTPYYRYKNVILYLTTKAKPKLLNNTHVKIGKAGEAGAFHIDHNYSIYQAWKNKVSPLVIGSIHNLQVLPWRDNISKFTKSDIDLSNLLTIYGINQEQSLQHFMNIIHIIDYDIEHNVPSTGAHVLERFHAANIR